MQPQGPSCQSCGMPLSRDEQGGGTNADGSRSTEYCSHCYQRGQFSEPNITATEMMAKVGRLLQSRSLPPAMIEKLTAEIPKLKRWAR